MGFINNTSSNNRVTSAFTPALNNIRRAPFGPIKPKFTAPTGRMNLNDSKPLPVSQGWKDYGQTQSVSGLVNSAQPKVSQGNPPVQSGTGVLQTTAPLSNSTTAPLMNTRGGVDKVSKKEKTGEVKQGSTGLSYSGLVRAITDRSKISNEQADIQRKIQQEAEANKIIGQDARNIADNYSKEIANVGKLGAGAVAGDLSTGSNVVGSGNAAIASQSASSRMQALAQAEQAALQGTAQQLTGQSQTQTGFNQAATSANQQQATGIIGLTNAAGYAQPNPAAYGQTVFNPLTGQYEGNSGLPPETLAQYAQMAANGQYSAIPSSITSNPVLSAQLNQAAQQINPNFNPIASAAQGATQASNIQTLGTAGASAAAGLTQKMSDMQASANGAEQNFELLANIAEQGGVNNADQPMLNQIEQNVKKGLTGNDAVIQFRSIIQTVRSQYAQILGGGTITVEALQEAQQIIPDNISLNSLKNLGVNLKSDAQNRIGGIQQQINQLSSASQGSNNFSNNSFQTVNTAIGPINTNW